MLLIKFILLLISMMTGYFLGYLFTETKYYLAKYPVFRFKAFECRKCLSFHIAWITSTAISLLFADWVMVLVGFILAFSLFFALLMDEKEKTITIEEYNRKEKQ